MKTMDRWFVAGSAWFVGIFLFSFTGSMLALVVPLGGVLFAVLGGMKK